MPKAPKLQKTLSHFNKGDKAYIVDTNVLVHDPESINVLSKGNILVIPMVVVEELDELKHRYDDVGTNARHVSRLIDDLAMSGDVISGAPINGDGFLCVFHNGFQSFQLPRGMKNNADAVIILTAMEWQKKRTDKKVVLVSKDVNLRIKAKALGIESQTYKEDQGITRTSDFYSGLATVDLPEKHFGGLAKDWMKSGKVRVGDVRNFVDLEKLYPNQCVLFNIGNLQIGTIFKRDRGILKVIPLTPVVANDDFIRPKNWEQVLAHHLLLDPDIILTSLAGVAGTGKTLMALMVAMELLNSNGYKKISVYRPNVIIGEEMGFLPGEIEEKFKPFTIPVLDALSLLLRGNRLEAVAKGAGKNPRHGKENDPLTDDVWMMQQMGLLEISPIIYIRGRTLHHQIVIIDEAQNLTPRQIKTMATRIGEGSKLIVTGDIEQVDTPYLDSRSNGLVHLAERMKGAESTAHFVLTKGERSPFAEMAAKLL